MVDFSQRPTRRLDLGSELGRGDRVPNFWLPDQAGQGVMFYEAVQGRPILLVLHRATQVPAQRAVLESLARTARALDAHVFAVGHDTVAAHAALGLDMPLLADLEGRITRALAHGLAVAGGDAPVVLACDPNQRLLDAFAVTDDGAASDRLGALFVPFRRQTGAPTLTRIAPVLIVPDVLDEAWRRRLIALWHGDHQEGRVATHVGAGVEDRINYGTKRRLDHTITDRALIRELARAVSRRIAPEMAKAFHFEGFWFEPFIVMAYDAARADFFRPHRDNLIPEFANRRFALTLNLNTGDYEGGDLRFPEYGDEVYAAPAGGALVFSCSLLHEALPVTQGRRFALLSFMRGDAPPATVKPRPA